MAPPRSACGSYAAYRRHLRLGEAIDAQCRAAQRAHDSGRSTAAPARVARQAKKQAEKAAETPEPLTAAPLTEEGHVSRVEVLKEMLDVSRELVSALKKTDPQRAYLQMREQREILRELSELQGNGQVKGVTLADQLAEARARRRAEATAS